MSLPNRNPIEGQWNAVEEREDKEEDQKYSDNDEGKIRQTDRKIDR